ncbi:MAG: hypothetical protein KGZ30_01015 [Anaplasmataceae bacterium]|nr:hypothetical protein [Anaplasmataceae bacterium]
MNNPKKEVITLPELNKKLDEEAKRLVREKEDGIVKYISKKANLDGNSEITFRKNDKTKITVLFRLNENNNLRLATEERFLNKK